MVVYFDYLCLYKEVYQKICSKSSLLRLSLPREIPTGAAKVSEVSEREEVGRCDE